MGSARKKTTWFRVAAWRQQAELASQYLTKGQKVLVVGELEDPQLWTDRDGNQCASLEVTARDIRFLSSREESMAMGGGGQQAEPAAAAGGGETAASDEEIPF